MENIILHSILYLKYMNLKKEKYLSYHIIQIELFIML
nr:MAG TPA: hypothetical protein [Caudoviricetes sp.]